MAFLRFTTFLVLGQLVFAYLVHKLQEVVVFALALGRLAPPEQVIGDPSRSSLTGFAATSTSPQGVIGVLLRQDAHTLPRWVGAFGPGGALTHHELGLAQTCGARG
eukprot:scaffold34527_cov26-Tisochrysis_lutea.AAC.1